MEPGEKFIRRPLEFVFMILAFIVAIVFGEFYRGMGWLGALIFDRSFNGRTGHVSLEGFEIERNLIVWLARTLKIPAGGSMSEMAMLRQLPTATRIYRCILLTDLSHRSE